MFKIISIVFFSYIITVHISCEKSFTLVIDKTGSMEDEILQVRANIGKVLDSVDRAQYTNFVLVPFKDSGVESIFTTPSIQDYLTQLNSLRTTEGADCPESSLAGIVAALRASEKESTIFVFTDGYAKDSINFPRVESLCKETHSQVVIFLSGYCLPNEKGPVGDVEVYYDIAKACSGAMLKWDSLVDLRESFRFMKAVISTEWTDVITYDKYMEYRTLSISIDRFTSDVMLVVSGLSPAVEVLRSNLEPLRLENVLRTIQPMVIRITPDVGEYTANIRGQGPLSVTYYKRSFIPFKFGFSTKSPRNLRETSSRPIAGWNNYILIDVDESIHLRSVEWLNHGESIKQVLLLKRIPSGSYVASVFVEEGKKFRFWVVGEDLTDQREIKGASKVVAPQMPVKENSAIQPKIELLDKDLGLVDYGTSLTLAAKVVAFPKPDVQWHDADNPNEIFQSETILLEIPSIFISYVTIPTVTKNFTITCKAKNSILSQDSKDIDVFVNRTFTFEVLQSPEDAAVEYDTEHQLLCKVDAYPEAAIKWYLNDTLVDTSSSYSRLSIEDNSLVIKNMRFEDVGTYECRASNDVETKNLKAVIEITGVEVPEIEGTETEIELKLTDSSAEIECRISKGKPEPEIVWKYKASDKLELANSLPYGVSSSSTKIVFDSVNKSLAGIYRCIASNIMGADTKDFNVKILAPPVIKNSELEAMLVRQGKDVSLPCEVEATPEATVRWEISQDDMIILFDHRHSTDENHTHHFKALQKDSGNYHCVAENSVGKAEKTVMVNVLVTPYIEPQQELFYANIGHSVTLPCNVVRGNPTPVIRWEFRPKDSTTSIKITRTNSENALHIAVVSENDEGTYVCIAENQFGSDNIKYQLVVQ